MRLRIIILLFSLIACMGCTKEENETIEIIDFTGTYKGDFQHINGNPEDFPYRGFTIYVLDEITLNMEVTEYIFNADSSDYVSLRYYFEDNSFYDDGSFEVELFDQTFVNGIIEGESVSGNYYVTNGSSGSITANKVVEE